MKETFRLCCRSKDKVWVKNTLSEMLKGENPDQAREYILYSLPSLLDEEHGHIFSFLVKFYEKHFLGEKLTEIERNYNKKLLTDLMFEEIIDAEDEEDVPHEIATILSSYGLSWDSSRHEEEHDVARLEDLEDFSDGDGHYMESETHHIAGATSDFHH